LDWYIKKEDNSVFGPIGLPELKNWAAGGRVAPKDTISTDKSNWRTAHENTELHMDWTVELEDGGVYGPIHLLAFCDFLTDESVSFQTPISNIRYNVTYQLGEVLLPAVINRNNILLNAINTLTARIELMEKTAKAEPSPNIDNDPVFEATGDKQAQWQAAMRDREKHQKNAIHWETLYKDEAKKTELRETEMQNELRELRQENLLLTTQLDKIKSELKGQKNINSEFEQFTAIADHPGDDQIKMLKNQFKTLLESYNDISMQYERLSTQITGQSDELDHLRSAKTTTQKKADERIHSMMEDLKIEREEADDARRKLSEVEKNYNDLLKSYRGMNDQLIKLRQQIAPTMEPESDEDDFSE